MLQRQLFDAIEDAAPLPVTCAGLVQLCLGGPLPHYKGGLLVTRLRHFDAQRQRPGLPPDVAVLVSKMTEEKTELHLVNLSASQHRQVLVQAGSMGGHHCKRFGLIELHRAPL